MKYAIFSVDNTRQTFIRRMEALLGSWDRVYTDCVDGRIPEKRLAAMEKHPYPINFDAKVGQLGIWYTVLNAMEHAPIVTFEDDAVLNDAFGIVFEWRFSQLPEDADFFSLFIPRDSDHLYTDDKSVSRHLCRTYQRYGGVSMYYTEQGVKKIKALLERDGITGQYDDVLYHYSKTGELNGYCSKPSETDLVYITGFAPSIVQETDYI